MTVFSFLKAFIDPLFKNKIYVVTLLFSERFSPAHFSHRFNINTRNFVFSDRYRDWFEWKFIIKSITDRFSDHFKTTAKVSIANF
jgi:hypothetical protein